ncbi:hypothetical protein [Clostridium vincentii]|uniref:YhfM-like domain-containing protein n=1 Tax=Clostridium vincentii TaxID=52704 RepID=A0A2T0BHC5_9CLOT|nr:hypothetical protein [Clostridium vincentii]PRR83299.1 hypothetical protein CLVI_10980 [Clostridium vincentii]
MRKIKYLIVSVLVVMMTTLSGCGIIDSGLVKLNFRNNDFEYIKENKVNKIVIQSSRDSGFKFVVNDSNAINDIYKILCKGKVKGEKTSLDPDYVFEVYAGDEVKSYNYVVSVDERGVGNFSDEDTAYLISKNLDDTILQNLSIIRKPRDFEDIYYNTILKVLEKDKDELTLNGNTVGVDILGDVDCLKYMLSVDLKSFENKLEEVVPGTKIINKDASKFDTIITVKNRGYNSQIFKTTIILDNKKDKSYETYYVQGTYEYKSWQIEVSEANEKPDTW